MSQSQTEMVRLQRAKWAVLSTVVQAQTVIVGSALTAAITTGEPAAWVSFGVILIGSLMTVVGRFAAEGPLTWAKPAPQTTEVEIVTPPRGSIRVALLAGIAVVGLALCALLGGCASTLELSAKKVVHVRWDQGPPCLVEVRLDDEAKPRVTVDAPDACPAGQP